MIPNWLPDWRDPKAYPKATDTSLKQWAWEFLRRNTDYQADFCRLSAGDYEHGGELSQELGEKYGIEIMCDPAINNPPIGRLSFETQWSPTYRINYGPERLSHHADPEYPEIVDYGMLPGKPGEVVVKMDLTWPLKIQPDRLGPVGRPSRGISRIASTGWSP